MPSLRPQGWAWGAAPPLRRALNREWVAVSGAESDLIYPDSISLATPSLCAARLLRGVAFALKIFLVLAWTLAGKEQSAEERHAIRSYIRHWNNDLNFIALTGRLAQRKLDVDLS
jgi:hypothetical protein